MICTLVYIHRPVCLFECIFMTCFADSFWIDVQSSLMVKITRPTVRSTNMLQAVVCTQPVCQPLPSQGTMHYHPAVTVMRFLVLQAEKLQNCHHQLLRLRTNASRRLMSQRGSQCIEYEPLGVTNVSTAWHRTVADATRVGQCLFTECILVYTAKL